MDTLLDVVAVVDVVALPDTLPVRDPTKVVAVKVPDDGTYDKAVAVLSI